MLVFNPARDEAVWEPQGGRRGRASKNISSARLKVLKALKGISGDMRGGCGVRAVSIRYFGEKWMENTFSSVTVLTLTTV